MVIPELVALVDTYFKVLSSLQEIVVGFDSDRVNKDVTRHMKN